MQPHDGKIRVMLVDDSAVVRGMIQAALREEPGMVVVATATHGAMAVDMLRTTPIDVIILDIEMPVMDGMTALPLLLQTSPATKIIMASTLTQRNAEISVRALQLGASDYVAKPTANDRDSLPEFYRQLRAKIRALGAKRLLSAKETGPSVAAPPLHKLATLDSSVATDLASALRIIPRMQAIAIASSTGGPQALLSLFTELKGRIANIPIFVTQHMPPTFTAILADHLRTASGMPCYEAKDGEEVQPGVIYIAPGDFHMVMERKSNETVRVLLNKEPPENFCRPAADPMLRSLAKIYGKHLLTLVLTGMGSDGAKGAAEVVKAGGLVLAQNEASCVVYGMPKAVVDAQLARAVLPLQDMGACIAQAMGAA